MLDFVESVLDTIGDVLAMGVEMIFPAPAVDHAAPAPVTRAAETPDD